MDKQINGESDVGLKSQPDTPRIVGGRPSEPEVDVRQTVSAPFPTEVLPETMANMVRAVSALNRTPDALAACCGLAAASAAIGKGLEVASLPGTTTPGNLYVLLAVPSGGGKSQTFNKMVTALLNYERKLVEEVEAENEAADEAGKKPAPTLICENITIEGLVRLLRDNNGCLASLSADGRDVVDIIRGRYRGKNQQDDGI